MSRDTFDAVLASTPQGPVAGRVTGKGEHWIAKQPLPSGLQHWTSPPPIKPFTRTAETAQMPDLRGTKFGRFTVIGLLALKHSEGAQWVVRCACGDFEARSTRSIRRALASPPSEEHAGRCDRCHNCAQLVRIKWKYKNQGARPISDFFTEVKAP